MYTWDFTVVQKGLGFLLAGLGITILVTVASVVMGLVLGLILALARVSRIRPLGWVAYGYVEFFRNTPLLIQLIWLYYCLPILVGLNIPPLLSGILALGLNSAAYLAEIYRAGIGAVGRGQMEAALSLGMNTPQAMRKVILPQAVTAMIPPISSTFLTLFKESSLVSTVAIADLMYQARVLATITFRPLEILTTTAVIYFLLTYPVAIVMNLVYQRTRTA
jgi:His/Glu/Gln/Arg/opine family amino acid ABC transporter permease subunit